MKTRRFLFTSLGFLAGMIAGVTLFSLMSFTGAPSSSPSAGENVAITATQANALLNAYLSGAAPMNQVLKGFVVEKSQLNAMNAIAIENARLTGFRIYLGKDPKGNKVGIVVGVDAEGKDAVANTIYSTDAPGAGPCPTLCDATSPITGNK